MSESFTHRIAPLFFLIAGLFPIFSLAQHKKKLVWYNQEKTKLHLSYHVLSLRPHIIDSLYEEYFPNGQLRSRGYYKANKPVGTWEYFYENGKTRMVGEILHFKNHGNWTYYYENGEKYMEGQQENGLKQGFWITYYDNGKLKSKGNYLKGHPVGTWQYFYEDGAPKAISNYNQGRGLYREYYKSGQLKMEGVLQDGKSDSTWNYYYENGKIKATGIERNGAKDGFWKFYHEDGLASSEGLYLNGVPFGNWRYYYENGALSTEGMHKNGEKDGFWKLYYPTGEFKAETQFSLGEGPYKEYYESGKLKVTGYIRKGVNENQWLYYYEDGTLEGKCLFEHGEGDFVGYYPNGKVKMEGRIQDGVKTGVWKLYKPEGELAGYYKTYYEDKQAVFVPLTVEDSLKEDVVKVDTIIPNKKIENDTKKTVKKRKKYSKIRYFRPKVNEYKAFIFSMNPIAPLIYRQLPLYFEYMIEERLGIEFIYTFYNSPFVGGSSNLPDRSIYYTGNGFELVQKFYHRTNNLGSLYFGQSLRFKILDFGASVNDTTTGSTKSFHYKLHQKSLEYSILAGDRIFMSGYSDKPGWTFDFFVGVGVGTLLENSYSNGMGYFDVNDVFSPVPTNKTYFFGKLGLSLGYIF